MARHPRANELYPHLCMDWNQSRDFTCSLARHHDGMHEAWYGHRVGESLAAKWPNQQPHVITGL